MACNWAYIYIYIYIHVYVCDKISSNIYANMLKYLLMSTKCFEWFLVIPVMNFTKKLIEDLDIEWFEVI